MTVVGIDGTAVPETAVKELGNALDGALLEPGDAGYDDAAPSLMLFEGVAVYLEESVIASAARELASVAAPGTRLAVSASPLSEPQQRQRFAAIVAAIGEPARSFMTAAETSALLADAGWHDSPLSDEARDVGFVLAVRP